MSHRAGAAAPPDGRVPPPRRPGGRRLRRLVNVWLVVHLAAIVIAPASVAPSSALADAAWEWVAPYLGLLYLDHGNHFFAPEPGESTLLAFEARRGDGTVARGCLPDRGIGPRLLYHRYFMLTEHMAGASDELRPLWHASYARHLGREYGARQVRLTQLVHLLPTMERIRGGGRLDDPESYEAHPLGVFRCDD